MALLNNSNIKKSILVAAISNEIAKSGQASQIKVHYLISDLSYKFVI